MGVPSRATLSGMVSHGSSENHMDDVGVPRALGNLQIDSYLLDPSGTHTSNYEKS